jgi:predicted cation transporter
VNVADDSSLDTRERDAARAWLIRLAMIAAVIAIWTGSSAGFVVGGVVFIGVGAAVAVSPRPTRASIVVLGNAHQARLADLAGAAMFGVIGVYLIVARTSVVGVGCASVPQ